MRDGMMTGNEHGQLVRVFAPPWWKVWRWAAWPFTKRRTRVQVRHLGKIVTVRAVFVS